MSFWGSEKNASQKESIYDSHSGSFVVVVSNGLNKTYVRYANNVTPLSGVNTTASGTFSSSFAVPSVGNGVYNVTSIDSQGNKGVASLTVDVAVPEGFSIGVAVLLSSLAVIASSRYFRKRPRIVD